MNINDMTIGQAKELASMFGQKGETNSLDSHAIGQKVIIRTYSAGVWFGTLDQKSGKEVILKDARRMWKWWAKKSISLSGVAQYGIKHEDSKICPAVENVWLEAIEIISLTDDAIKSIESAADVEAS